MSGAERTDELCRRGLRRLAYHLPSGKRILIVERGDYVPREKANWDPHAVNVDCHDNTRESWLDKDGKALHPHTSYHVHGHRGEVFERAIGCSKRLGSVRAVSY